MAQREVLHPNRLLTCASFGGTEQDMSLRSDDITWTTWSQKWGDWTTWFRKVDVPLEPLQLGLVLPMARAESGRQNVRTGRELLVVRENVLLE